jgi:hypothetical protein
LDKDRQTILRQPQAQSNAGLNQKMGLRLFLMGGQRFSMFAQMGNQQQSPFMLNDKES